MTHPVDEAGPPERPGEERAVEDGVGPAPPGPESDPPADTATAPPEDAPAVPRWWHDHPVLAGMAVAAGLLLLVVLVQLVTWPDVAALARENPETTAFIARWEERNDRQARRIWVPYERISPHLKRAVLVSEDINFFSHGGFATDQIRDALATAWERKRFPRGASTLTQQLAKNLWLSPSRNPLRKVKEAILTVQLERNLSKRRIFELYLNVVELGPGIYGAEAASRHWYGTSAAGLGERRAAELAAALPAPDRWHPGADSRSQRNRVRTILRRMERAQFLWKVI